MITSRNNEQVKMVTALQKKGRERSARDLFVVEGLKMFLEAPAERIRQVFVSERFRAGEQWKEHAAAFENCACTVVADQVFEHMSDTQSPQGVLCLLEQFHYVKEDLLGEVPLVMVLEDVRDPGNLGTILRAGEGAGITGVLMTEGCVDICNPKVIRSTMGSIYRVPYAVTDDLQRDMSWLKKAGVELCAAHLKGKHSYDMADYCAPTAFMIGNESQGLTQEASSLADILVRIPMLGQVESLNAAMAAGILMYEAARQRRGRRGETL